ncbi:hypothetical protein GWI33_021333 [Rhynchophorus ferrugineus]|uniref:DUF243 domain-containing protein n=1 Tax=Rhynchophorus ferrugineus TaxID=354439 RepID=A0A834HNU0_RHYFE|nr:hypothetical protein GWI33_021333 [Rhynchophorus ferrugineus]
MRAFLITALCLGISQAKPQYNYPAPSAQQSFGSVSVGGGALTGGLHGSGVSVGGFNGGGFSGSGSTFGGLNAGGIALGGGLGGSGVSSGGFGNAGTSGGSSGSFISGGSAGSTLGGSAAGLGGGVQVQKHIYVHVAPPEPEEFRTPAAAPGVKATKHYKIIFIKAPSYPSYQQQILQQQALNEEKTLVYVLVKKPEAPGDITLPAVASPPPSKPEVYFIRYKTKSQAAGGAIGAAAGVVSNVVNVGSAGSSSSVSVTGHGVGNAGIGGLDSGFVGSSGGGVAPRPTYGVPV